MFFARIPNNIGLIASDGPALRIWYEDPTLEAGFYSSYKTRLSTDETGRDYFFRFDSVSVLVEVIPGSAESAEQRTRPGWRRDHAVLASMFLYAGNTLGAAEEYEKLWQAAPEQASFALYAATAFEAAGDTLRAKALYVVARRALGDSLVRQESAVLVQSARANALRPTRGP
jgi:hypothetical protein